jgi:hypothetical protein
VALPGYTVFSARDARLAARRMLERGPVRLKKPLSASGQGQTLVTTMGQLDLFLEQFDADEMATYGLVLEENLRDVRTLSTCCARAARGHAAAPPSSVMNSCRFHSITSSARASSVGGTSTPSALAVGRLMTSSNLVGWTTGRSAGFSPLRMRPV